MSLLHHTFLFTIILTLSIGSTLTAQEVRPKTKRDRVGFFAGKKKVIDYIYDEARYKYNDSYAVRKGNYWGVVGTDGKELIPCKYDLIRYNWGKIGYIVANDGNFGVVSRADSLLLAMDYQNIDHYYHDSIALVKAGDQWTYLVGPERKLVSDTSLVFKYPEERALFQPCTEVGTDPKERVKCSDRAMLTYIYENIKYPEKAIRKGIEGMVVINFIIAEDGTIKDPKVIREIGEGCGDEALRLVRSMQQWVPARQDGKAVASNFNLPVKYKLTR